MPYHPPERMERKSHQRLGRAPGSKGEPAGTAEGAGAGGHLRLFHFAGSRTCDPAHPGNRGGCALLKKIVRTFTNILTIAGRYAKIDMLLIMANFVPAGALPRRYDDTLSGGSYEKDSLCGFRVCSLYQDRGTGGCDRFPSQIF